MQSGHSVNVSHSVVGVAAPGARHVSDVHVYSSGNIQHAQADAVGEALSRLSSEIAMSRLADPAKRSAQFELDAVASCLSEPETAARNEGVAFHIRRLIDSVKDTQPLLDSAMSVANLLSIAL